MRFTAECRNKCRGTVLVVGLAYSEHFWCDTSLEANVKHAFDRACWQNFTQQGLNELLLSYRGRDWLDGFLDKGL